MFELEQAITEWRRQMLAAGIERPEPLEELEIHLREEIEQQMKSGTNARQAFEVATRQVGSAFELEREFQIAQPLEHMKQKITYILVIIAVLATGLGLILPAIAKWRTDGVLDASAISSAAIWIAFCMVCGAIGVLGSLKRRPKA